MDLTHFKIAHQRYFDLALAELKAEKKRSHWMWFMFPQLAALGRSSTAKFYGLANATEACAFLADPVLGANLRQLSQTLLDTHSQNAIQIFGVTDALKLRSSMTLFAQASNELLFRALLDKFFQGQSDPLTLSLLANQRQ